MEKSIHPEIVDALKRIPTDTDIVYKNISEWERVGDSSQLATICTLAIGVLMAKDSSIESLREELRLFRESVEDVRKVDATKLAHKLQLKPELREGFTKEITEDGDVLLLYKGSTRKADMYEGYDQLHYKLIDIYGFKDIDYKTINNALLKSFNWSQEDVKRWDSAEVAMAVLSKAEFLYTRHKNKKVTIPEIKLQLPYKLETKIIKNILLNAGWITVKQGSCKTLFFTQPETH